MAKVGQTFSTGNAVVGTLKAGSVLRVSGQGQLEIVSLPEPTLGDKVTDFKSRTGTVVRLSNRADFDPTKPIAVFADNVVRNIN
jgi:hypothetical protein